jgi:hypothetical protein
MKDKLGKIERYKPVARAYKTAEKKRKREGERRKEGKTAVPRT